MKRSIKYWLGAGVPANKIQMGLPAYAKVFNSTLKPGPIAPNSTFDSPLYQPQLQLEVSKTPPAGWTDAKDNPLALKYEKDFCGWYRQKAVTLGVSEVIT